MFGGTSYLAKGLKFQPKFSAREREVALSMCMKWEAVPGIVFKFTSEEDLKQFKRLQQRYLKPQPISS